MFPKAHRPVEEPTCEKRRQEERNSDSERINGQKSRSARGRPLRACNEQDRREHRADAWRPAEGEGKPDDVGTNRSGGLSADLNPCFAVKQADAEQAEE